MYFFKCTWGWTDLGHSVILCGLVVPFGNNFFLCKKQQKKKLPPTQMRKFAYVMSDPVKLFIL